MKKIFFALACLFTIFSCEDNDVTYPVISVKDAEDFVDSRDGRVYKCIEIGDQIWMAENLAYVVITDSISGCRTFGEAYLSQADFANLAAPIFRDSLKNAFQRNEISDPVDLEDADKPSTKIRSWCSERLPISTMIQNAESDPNFTGDIIDVMKRNQLEIESSVFYEHLNEADENNGSYSSKYGMLYSYEAALSAVPTDGEWRLPSDADWKKLEAYLGMSENEIEKDNDWRGSVEGELLKVGEHGIGFNALYGGGKLYISRYDERDDDVTYTHEGQNAYFWTSEKLADSDQDSLGMIRSVAVFSEQILRTTTQLKNLEGHPLLFNVRLVKDKK